MLKARANASSNFFISFFPLSLLKPLLVVISFFFSLFFFVPFGTVPVIVSRPVLFWHIIVVFMHFFQTFAVCVCFSPIYKNIFFPMFCLAGQNDFGSLTGVSFSTFYGFKQISFLAFSPSPSFPLSSPHLYLCLLSPSPLLLLLLSTKK